MQLKNSFNSTKSPSEIVKTDDATLIIDRIVCRTHTCENFAAKRAGEAKVYFLKHLNRWEIGLKVLLLFKQNIKNRLNLGSLTAKDEYDDNKTQEFLDGFIYF